MPPNFFDYVKGGLVDFAIDNTEVTRHARKRARERKVPLEEVRVNRNDRRGVWRGNKLITVFTQDMANGPRPSAWKEERDRIGRLIVEIGACPSLHGTPHYEFFRDLFQYHPEAERKRVTEIRDISLQKFSKMAKRIFKPSQLQFKLYYGDGTSDTISWVDCVERQCSSRHPTPSSMSA
jgi:hypothetical protein